jgi:hypothetical protein
VFKAGSVILAALCLAACVVPKPQRESAPGAVPAPPHVEVPAGATAPTGADTYRIDAAQSELRLLVHRAGSLARLGHNHVIVNRALGGWVKFSGDTAAATFLLTVPVADFVVDDARTRAEEGGDFADEVPPDAKAGTRHNMLSAALLDGDHFPAIVLKSIAVVRTSDALSATITAEIAGHRSTLVVPFEIDTAGGRIAASGTAVLRQSALGLAPFSVMLGALQVQDEFTVKFKLVALAN